jgi:hypothetical protein
MDAQALVSVLFAASCAVTLIGAFYLWASGIIEPASGADLRVKEEGNGDANR